MSQSAARQRLEGAGAGGRVGDEAEIGFAQENELAVAGETPRQTVRKPEASVCGKTLTLSAPPRPAENAATVPRITFT